MRLTFLTLTSLLLILQTDGNSLARTADDSANIVSKILGSFQGTNSMNLTHFFTSFQMPNCLQRCMPAMHDVGAILGAFNKPSEMRNMCSELTEASKCATAAGCDEMFVGAISNAFQFVCAGDVNQVSGQLTCIQDSAGDLQQECEHTCSVQSDLIDTASKNAVNDLISMERICNSTNCLVECYQNNIQKYCDIGENNIFDTIFSQLDSLQPSQPFASLMPDTPKKKGFGRLLGWMMPNGCDDKKLKVKIPNKIRVAPIEKPIEKPKTVGPSVKEKPVQKASSAHQNSTTDVVFPAKTANISSAAIMINGKVQTLQCQMLDLNGNVLKTPDFESLSNILSDHFHKTPVQKPTEAPKKSDGGALVEGRVRSFSTQYMPCDISAIHSYYFGQKSTQVPSIASEFHEEQIKQTLKLKSERMEFKEKENIYTEDKDVPESRSGRRKIRFRKLVGSRNPKEWEDIGSQTDYSDMSEGQYSDETHEEKEMRDRNNEMKMMQRSCRINRINLKHRMNKDDL